MDYQSTEWDKLRRKVLRRDGYSCQFCGKLCLGKKRNGESPIVDHIMPVKEYPHLAFNEDNLRVLCRSCDNKRHSEKGRGYDITPAGLDGFPMNSEWSD